jgi:hypothetical protein
MNEMFVAAQKSARTLPMPVCKIISFRSINIESVSNKDYPGKIIVRLLLFMEILQSKVLGSIFFFKEPLRSISD